MKCFPRGMIGRFGNRCLAVAPVAPVHAQPDPDLKSTFGEVTLKAGFLPDPLAKDLTAGGPIKTNLGAVNAHVAKAPDFRLNYTSGKYPLTFSVEAKGTTLLINLPDGTWIADDDGGKGLNPLIRLAKPQSGRYDIFVGTVGNRNVPARLLITERTPFVALKGPRPDCYVLSAGVDNYRNAATSSPAARNDAHNTATAFKIQQGTVFRKVETEVLLDDKATQPVVLDKFKKFTNRGAAGDYMVAVPERAWRTATNWGNKTWYFLTADYQPNKQAAKPPSTTSKSSKRATPW